MFRTDNLPRFFHFIFVILIVVILLVPCRAMGQRHDKINGKTNFFVFASVPYMNQFYFRMPGGDKANGGFWGITAGAGYHYKPGKFYTWQVGAITDFFMPVIGAVDRWPDSTGHLVTESMNNIFISVRDNYVWNRFDFGYGFVVSRHSWQRSDSYMDTVVSDRYENWGIGPSLSAYYRLGRVLGVGIMYQPQVVSFSRGLKYEHTASVDVRVMFKRRSKEEAARVQEQKRLERMKEQ